MKVHFFTKAHLPHNQNSSIYILACQKKNFSYNMLSHIRKLYLIKDVKILEEYVSLGGL